MKDKKMDVAGLIGLLSLCWSLGLAAGVGAEPLLRLPQALTGCPVDMVRVGPACVDIYEASVWANSDGTGTQYGVRDDDYPCGDDGNDCRNKIFAVSRVGVLPSRDITWFQAQQACRNVGKELISNADWQAAAAGTPLGGCNRVSEIVTTTGRSSACVSRWGAYDMVGNVEEWVADWVPRSTNCGRWSELGQQCLAGAATEGAPGALLRGGDAYDDGPASALAIDGRIEPSSDSSSITGFRCAR